MTNSIALGVAYTDQIINGGTVDNTPIGATTPSTAVFSTLTATTGTVTNLTVSGQLLTSSSAPGATITAATYTVGANDRVLIFNGAAANVTVTLPSASANPGRGLRMLNYSGTYTVISASSNVGALATGTAGTAILAATAGKWCELVSNGTNWLIIASN